MNRLKTKRLHKVFATLLLAAATMWNAACTDNLDNPVNPTPQKKKISKIYTTKRLTLEIFNPMLGTWLTIQDIQQPRQLDYEFIWNGDQLDKMLYGSTWLQFIYDENGFLTDVENQNENLYYHFENNEDGQLCRFNDTEFFYADGRLQKVVTTNEEEENPIVSETRYYTWTGDNVTHTEQQILFRDGTNQTVNFNYTISDYPNPLAGITFLQIPLHVIFMNYDGLDALNKNMISRCVTGSLVNTSEFTVTDGLVTGTHELHVTQEGETSRATIYRDCELEYCE